MAFGRQKSDQKARAPLDPSALLDHAVKSLASKMKSERDLRRKLAERAESPEAVEAVLLKLKELGYLSDARFAADYTRLRQENEKLGRRRVQQGLMQRGIAQPLAAEALGKAYDEIDEVALARDYIARKRLNPPAGDREQKQKDTARLMRRLVAAGFSTTTIWKVLRAWDADLEETDIAEPGDI